MQSLEPIVVLADFRCGQSIGVQHQQVLPLLRGDPCKPRCHLSEEGRLPLQHTRDNVFVGFESEEPQAKSSNETANRVLFMVAAKSLAQGYDLLAGHFGTTNGPVPFLAQLPDCTVIKEFLRSIHTSGL